MKTKRNTGYRAKEACKNSGYQVAGHFEDIFGMVSIGSGEFSQELLSCPQKTVN